MEGIFFSTNVSDKCFFEGGVWKTSRQGETFISHLKYLVVITEIKIQSSAVAVK